MINSTILWIAIILTTLINGCFQQNSIGSVNSLKQLRLHTTKDELKTFFNKNRIYANGHKVIIENVTYEIIVYDIEYDMEKTEKIVSNIPKLNEEKKPYLPYKTETVAVSIYEPFYLIFKEGKLIDFKYGYELKFSSNPIDRKLFDAIPSRISGS
jgi:hypothetical protein